MGQVPVGGVDTSQFGFHSPYHQHSLIIGSGRLARHLQFYFETLGLPFSVWSRRDRLGKPTNISLERALEPATHVWLLISDSAIEPFAREQAHLLEDRFLIHCSGSLHLPNVAGWHPLMTFPENLYDFDFYSRIPFICDQDHPGIKEHYPQLRNPSLSLAPQDKARYHALCVIANNFTTLLWQESRKSFGTMGIEWRHLQPYLEKTMENLKQAPYKALTGPMARGDLETIQKNVESLEGSPLQALYQSFWEFFQSIGSDKTPAPTSSRPKEEDPDVSL
jgi:hypothetical protein